MNVKRLRIFGLLSATMLSTLAFQSASAQVAGTNPAPAANAESGIPAGVEEIIVTARKTQENIQNVPVTITAFTADALQKTDTKSVFDLASRTPGLYYGTSGGRNGGNKLQIRNFSTGTAGGSKASVFIDGVYMSGDYASTPLSNLERVEVLKGPQAVYFGRSTFVGAVNFVTRDPGREFTGRIEALAASFGEYDVQGHLTTPLGSMLSNDISFRYYDFKGPKAWTNSDGYHLGDQSTRSVSDKIVFQPLPDLTIRWYGSYVHDRDHIPQTSYFPLNTRNSKIVRPDGTIAYYYAGSVNIDHSEANAPNLYHQKINGFINEPGVERNQYRSVLSLDAKVAGQSLSGFAAYSDEKLNNNFDLSYLGAQIETAPDALGNPAKYAYNANNYYLKYRTQDQQYELRLSAPSDWRLRYTVGANYTKLYGRTRFNADPITPAGLHVYATPPLFGDSDSNVLGNPAKDTSGFGGLYFDLNSHITVSGEVRYQHEVVTSTNYLTKAEFKATFNSTLPRFNIQYKVNDDLQFYALYAKGNNPGGFNSAIPAANLPAGVNAAYPEETLYDYEFGVKSRWLDGKLTVNAAVYYMNYAKEQVQQSYLTNYPFPGSLSSLYNTNASSDVKGFELEANAVPVEGLDLRATASYGKAKYKSYCSSNYYALTGIATGIGCRSVAGFQHEGTPALQLSFFADYEHPINDKVTAYISGDYQYQSKIYLEEWNAAWMAPANIAGLRIGVRTGGFQLEGFIRNLFDDDHSPRTTRAGYQSVGGSFASAPGTLPVGARYPAVTYVINGTTYTTGAGNAGSQSVADTARRPRQFGVKASYAF